MLISHFTIITLTGDVTGSGTGSFAATIANNAVTDAKLRDSAALSVIGRSANSGGDPADIPAGTNDTLLRRTANTLDFGQLTVGMAPDGLWTYAKIQNVSATDRLLGRSSAGAGVIEEIVCTAAGRALIDDADAATQRGTLGLGSIATQSAGSVAITGGSINGTTIGGSTAAAGTFTALTSSGGAVTLTGNAASSVTTSSGALTMTSAATATWSTSAGTLTISGKSGINLQYDGSTKLSVGTGGITLGDGSAAIVNADVSTSAGTGTLSFTNSAFTFTGTIRSSDAKPSFFLKDTTSADTGFVVYGDASVFYIGQATDNQAITANLLSVNRTTGEIVTLGSIGSMALATLNFPSGGGTPVLVMNQASGAVGTPGSNTAGLIAKNVTTTCELFAWDEGGTETQLTAHATDGPDWLYDHDQPHPDRVESSTNAYTGTKEWINTSRQARLLERLLAGEDIAALPMEQRRFTHMITGLPRRDWDEDQQTLKERRDREIAEQQQRKKRADAALAAWEKVAAEEARALEEWSKLADQEREQVPRPTQTPRPSEFSEKLLEPHVMKPCPEWLKKRLAGRHTSDA